MTIFQMRMQGFRPCEVEAAIFHRVTGWELDSLDASEFSYCYNCLEHESEEIQEDCEAYRIVAGLMQRLLNTPCVGCGHPWSQHDRLRKEQPCVNRQRAGKPFDCPCPGFTRPSLDFSVSTFTVPGHFGHFEQERPDDRMGPNVSCHDDRWRR